MAMYYLNVGDSIFLHDNDGALKKATIKKIEIKNIEHFTEINLFLKEKNKDRLSVYGIESLGNKIFLDYADYLLETEYNIMSVNNQYIAFCVDFIEKNKKIYSFINSHDLSDLKKKQIFKKAHDIKSLYHFTNLKNIISILKLGLYPVSELEKKNIKFERNDEKRLDGMRNCNSLSISYPNTWYLNKISKENNEDYCIIEYDDRLLDQAIKKNLVNYSKYNAARSDTIIGKDLNCFIEMFRNSNILVQNPNTAYYSGQIISPIQRKDTLPLNYPSNDQAEVLIEGIIDNKYIKRIIFKNEYSYKLMKDYLKVYEIAGVIDESYFIKRDDFIRGKNYGKALLF